ncbi:MAG: hypothetical protein ACLQU4_14990 [Limisphaerales bacterium]
MLKGKIRQVAGNGEADSGDAHRDNPRVNAKIDDWIKNNEKHWAYIQALPRERLERALALHEVQKIERGEKLDAGIWRKINQDPDKKRALETMVKHLPEGERQEAMISLERQNMRTTARINRPQQNKTQGVGVAV